MPCIYLFVRLSFLPIQSVRRIPCDKSIPLGTLNVSYVPFDKRTDKVNIDIYL